jgi:Asp-tRNA(Asn)/Glu-tRNA(Gln) amidotransferase A subunit family amidase
LAIESNLRINILYVDFMVNYMKDVGFLDRRVCEDFMLKMEEISAKGQDQLQDINNFLAQIQITSKNIRRFLINQQGDQIMFTPDVFKRWLDTLKEVSEKGESIAEKLEETFETVESLQEELTGHYEALFEE